MEGSEVSGGWAKQVAENKADGVFVECFREESMACRTRIATEARTERPKRWIAEHSSLRRQHNPPETQEVRKGLKTVLSRATATSFPPAMQQDPQVTAGGAAGARGRRGTTFSSSASLGRRQPLEGGLWVETPAGGRGSPALWGWEGCRPSFGRPRSIR